MIWDTTNGPRVEDFGISEEDLANAPGMFFAEKWPSILGVAYLVAAAAISFIIFRVAGSWPAALFFTTIILAAGSVVLLPLAMLVLCASERVEERWLCRRFPTLRACLAYRKAVSDYDRSTRPRSVPDDPEWWRSAGEVAFRSAIGLKFDQVCPNRVAALDRESTGIDMVITTGESDLLIRCHVGGDAVPVSIAREVRAALVDRGASAAMILSAADPSPACRDYISGHSISIVQPWQLGFCPDFNSPEA